VPPYAETMPRPAPPPQDPEWGHGYGPGSGGVRLHYVRRGRGPVAVLLHGWPGFWYDWRHVIPRLTGQADVLAIDLRGFGESDPAPGDPYREYDEAILAADVLSLLDDLEVDRFALAGHDVAAPSRRRSHAWPAIAPPRSRCSTPRTRRSARGATRPPPSASGGTTPSTRRSGRTSWPAATARPSRPTCATSSSTGRPGRAWTATSTRPPSAAARARTSCADRTRAAGRRRRLRPELREPLARLDDGHQAAALLRRHPLPLRLVLGAGPLHSAGAGGSEQGRARPRSDSKRHRPAGPGTRSA
jgi:alpha/beta hydrolase fold